MKMRSLILLTAIVLITGCLFSALACSKQECPQLNKQAPEFSLNTLEGQRVSLKEFQGKPVMLNFWQTTCTWCRFQMPFLQAIYAKYASSGLAVLAVNVAEESDKVKPYIDETGYTFTVLLDEEGKVNTLYCVPGFPATLFMDQAGIIRNFKLGAFQSPQEVEEYLKILQ